MKDGEYIKIKCPECGALLTVEYKEGCESKKVQCPICKKTHLFSEFRLCISDDAEKTSHESSQQKPGKLLYHGQVLYLSKGVNTVGRKADSSRATLQIQTTDHFMSRMHAEIKFEKGFHFFRPLTDKNETRINGHLVGMGDCMILQNGDTIRLANTDIQFQFEDDDMTIV